MLQVTYPLLPETSCHLALCRLTLVCSLTKVIFKGLKSILLIIFFRIEYFILGLAKGLAVGLNQWVWIRICMDPHTFWSAGSLGMRIRIQDDKNDTKK
jgi:hypothetical protein